MGLYATLNEVDDIQWTHLLTAARPASIDYVNGILAPEGFLTLTSDEVIELSVNLMNLQVSGTPDVMVETTAELERLAVMLFLWAEDNPGEELVFS